MNSAAGQSTPQVSTQSMLCVLHVEYRRILKNLDYEPAAILSAWRENGWLHVSPGRKWYRSHVAGKLVDLIALNATALRIALGDDDAADTAG